MVKCRDYVTTVSWVLDGYYLVITGLLLSESQFESKTISNEILAVT